MGLIEDSLTVSPSKYRKTAYAITHANVARAAPTRIRRLKPSVGFPTKSGKGYLPWLNAASTGEPPRHWLLLPAWVGVGMGGGALCHWANIDWAFKLWLSMRHIAPSSPSGLNRPHSTFPWPMKMHRSTINWNPWGPHGRRGSNRGSLWCYSPPESAGCVHYCVSYSSCMFIQSWDALQANINLIWIKP